MRRNMMVQWACALVAVVAMTIGSMEAHAVPLVKSAAERVGPVTVGPVQCDAVSKPCDLKFILWGGEAATFHANGLATVTTPNSIFGQLGLRFTLVPGDDPVQQARDYLSGKTPIWRGTKGMLGEFAELFSRDPRTIPVEVLQQSWSRGDHMVAVASIKTISDLKGRSVCLQPGGPHVSMCNTILQTGGLRWSDVRIVWAKDITGPNGPAEMMKAGKCDAAFVVTPDMIGLTGGLESACKGKECSPQGAHVLVSTAQLTRSIADVYVVRKDFYDAHRDLVAKFVAGYLKGAEAIVDIQQNPQDPTFRAILAYMFKTWGPGPLPGGLEDANGLVLDCAFVGHPGNVAYFTDPQNSTGAKALTAEVMDLAVTIGAATKRGTILAPDWDWNGPPFRGYLQRMNEARPQAFNVEATAQALERLTIDGAMDDRVKYSFAVRFDVDETEFDQKKYAKDFDRVLELAPKYGGAVFAIRGHVDVYQLMVDFITCGTQNGVLTRRGTTGNYHYFVNSKPLDINATLDVVAAIESGAFDRCPGANPRAVVDGARVTSKKRAESVRDKLLAYAKQRGKTLDASQVQAQGVGVREPIFPTPKTGDQMAENRRVEFSITVVGEARNPIVGFDY
ncbi:ABC transporter substrate-binding protein [Candidatus Uhrbacteria bacterium]|nr:ABC transporter substrate-binding protein [Candidatus Uhrbacteria bacterium]